MKNSYNKGRLYTSIFNTVKHNKNKYGSELFEILITDAYVSAFKSK